jgi:hypothetical protein
MFRGRRRDVAGEDGVSEQAPVAPVWGRFAAHAVLAAVGMLALVTSLRLGAWRQSSPGEGLFPFLTALAMVVFGAAGLAQDWRKRSTKPRSTHVPAPGGRAGLARVAAYLGALIFYAASLEALGFITATSTTIIFILRFAERYSWLATLALTAGTVIGCQILFVLWLGAILPVGTLWESLFE